MTNEKDSDAPTDDAKEHSGAQSKFPARTPEQGEVRTNAADATQDQQVTAKEMRREFRWFEITSLVINGALAIIGVYALCIYNGQLTEMRKSTDAAHDAAVAAKQSADTQEHSFQMERRRAEDMEEAICDVRGMGMAALSHSFQMFVANNGKVTARNIEAHVEISLNAVPSEKKIRNLGNLVISVDTLAREKSLQKFLELPLSARDWDNIADTKQAIVESVSIQYENGFERIIKNTHCMVWFYFRVPGDKLNPIQGRGTDCDQLGVQLAGIPKQGK